jgi:hypothetical protein
MLPSLNPAFTIFAMPGSEITDCVPGHVLHVPVEALDGAHHLVLGAGALHVLRLRDHAEGVHADGELLDDLLLSWL